MFDESELTTKKWKENIFSISVDVHLCSGIVKL